MRFFSLSLLLLLLHLLLLPCSRFFAYHTLLHFLHIISHASEPAKWQSEWGSLKSASIRQRNVVRKCFALFTFLLHSVEALLVVACLLCFVVVLSVFWLRLSVSVSLCLSLFSRTSVIRVMRSRSRSSVALALVFGFIASLPVAPLNLLLSLTNCQVC